MSDYTYNDAVEDLNEKQAEIDHLSKEAKKLFLKSQELAKELVEARREIDRLKAACNKEFADVEKLSNQVLCLTKERAEMLALLDEIQWPPHADIGHPGCPVCLHDPNEHAKDCKLAATIKKLKGEE
jgi:myosin heavy subunit